MYNLFISNLLVQILHKNLPHCLNKQQLILEYDPLGKSNQYFAFQSNFRLRSSLYTESTFHLLTLDTAVYDF